MAKPVNKKLVSAILFPVVVLLVNVVALAGSGVETFEVVLGVSIAIVLIAGVTAFVLWRMSRKKKLLIPPLLAARESGATAYLYRIGNKPGLITVDTNQQLRLLVARRGRVEAQASAPAGAYSLGLAPFQVSPAATAEGVSVSTQDGSVTGLVVLVMCETKIRMRDEKPYRERANQALIRAGSGACSPI